MNAGPQNMYKGKQKLIEMESDEMPMINEFIKALPDFPTYTMKSIVVNADEDNTKEAEDSILQSIEMNETPEYPKSFPDCIAGDWLYLGDRSHSKSLEIIQDIGITHILCCSDIIPTYFLHSDANITYARIPVGDTYCANLYNYFFAAREFINLCNPLKSKNTVNKILVHCEVGMSRSAAVVIAYLVSSKVGLTEQKQYIFDIIQTKLDNFERVEYNAYKTKETENGIVFMKLNEAYYYTQSCRSITEPNLGFCKQLEKWEGIFHGKRSTLQDLPRFTSPYSKNDTKLGKHAAKTATTQESCDICMIM